MGLLTSFEILTLSLLLVEIQVTFFEGHNSICSWDYGALLYSTNCPHVHKITRTFSNTRKETHAERTHFADLQGEHLTLKNSLFQAQVQQPPTILMLLTGISEAAD